MSKFLDELPENDKKKRERRLNDDLSRRVSPQQARNVAASQETRTPESVKAGQYERQTITLLPQQKRLIRKLAKESGVGLLSFYRWMLDVALTAYDNGERPQPDEPIYRDVKVGHWSSK